MVGNTIPQFFDHVVLATHSPEALTLLQDSTDIEKEILGAIRYQSTAIVVHTDDSILPKNKLCKVSWNCATNNKHQQMCTYNSNMLHGLHSSVNFWVTVNPNISIDESKIIQRKVFAHPLVTRDSIQAQKRKSEINGYNRVWFAGAYWGNGFHEDGVVSAIDIAKGLGVDTAALL